MSDYCESAPWCEEARDELREVKAENERLRKAFEKIRDMEGASPAMRLFASITLNIQQRERTGDQ